MAQPATSSDQPRVPVVGAAAWILGWRVAASLAMAGVALAFVAGLWPLRLALSLCVPLALAGLLRSPADARRWREALPFLVVSAVLLLTPSLSRGRLPGVYELAALALSALAGWGAIIWLVAPMPILAVADSETEPPAIVVYPGWLPALIGVIAGAVAAALHYAMSGEYAVLQDEVLYLLQSDWLSGPHFGWPLASELLPSLRPEYTGYRNGVVFGQYPPGWPLLLGLLKIVHLRWWTAPLLAGITVVATLRLGHRLHSPLAGLLAAVLLASHAWFLMEGVGYMSHMATMTCLTVGAGLIIAAPVGRGPAGFVRWASAGFLLGATVAIRPLTGVTMGLTLGLWLFALRPCAATEWMRRAGLLALGAVPPLAFLLLYNWQTTGGPLLFGYQAVHGSLHSLGFGLRGFMLHGGGSELRQVAHEFPPTLAAARLGQLVGDISTRLVPIGMLVPLFWLANRSGCRVRWRYLLPFALLPGVHFFYFFTARTARFTIEIVPFALIGISCLLADLAARIGVGHVARVAAVLVAVNVATSAALWDDRGRGSGTVIQSAEAIDAARERYGRVVVFISERAPEWYYFRRLSIFNGGGLDGEVIVARDLGTANRDLLRRLPTHIPLRAVLDRLGAPLRLEPLEPPPQR